MKRPDVLVGENWITSPWDHECQPGGNIIEHYNTSSLLPPIRIAPLERFIEVLGKRSIAHRK